MKSRVARAAAYAVALALCVFAACGLYSSYLDREIQRLYQINSAAVDKAYNLKQKDKGTALLSLGLESGNLLMMGSSELNSHVPENPKNLFPNNLYGASITFTGHSHVQNYHHALCLAANSPAIGGNDLVIVESLQWFEGKEVGVDGFLSNFSEYLFYRFLQTDQISGENKRYLCQRFVDMEDYRKVDDYAAIAAGASESAGLDLLRRALAPYKEHLNPYVVHGDIDYPQTYLLARLYLSESLPGKAAYWAMQPYYALRGRFLELKDKFSAYRYLKSLGAPAPAPAPAELDWDAVYAAAEEEGRAECTNNDMYVYDSYYDEVIAERYESLAGKYADTPLMESPEWEDYEFFLSVCRDLGLKPYIVIMSTNGLYYDYVGEGKEKRDQYYQASQALAGEYGLDCLNLKDHEYEPYFYCDVMHLGWKGWPYVCQKVIEHFSE